MKLSLLLCFTVVFGCLWIPVVSDKTDTYLVFAGSVQPVDKDLQQQPARIKIGQSTSLTYLGNKVKTQGLNLLDNCEKLVRANVPMKHNPKACQARITCKDGVRYCRLVVHVHGSLQVNYCQANKYDYWRLPPCGDDLKPRPINGVIAIRAPTDKDDTPLYEARIQQNNHNAKVWLIPEQDSEALESIDCQDLPKKLVESKDKEDEDKEDEDKEDEDKKEEACIAEILCSKIGKYNPNLASNLENSEEPRLRWARCRVTVTRKKGQITKRRLDGCDTTGNTGIPFCGTPDIEKLGFDRFTATADGEGC